MSYTIIPNSSIICQVDKWIRTGSGVFFSVNAWKPQM
jgi:hypothetical protein